MSKTIRKTKEYKDGLRVEMEHIKTFKNDKKLVGKLVEDHLKERPDYYSMLSRMEKVRTKGNVKKFRRLRGME